MLMLTIALALAALILLRLTASVGFRLQLVDAPDARKRHSGHVPLTGGIGIVLSVLAGSALFRVVPFGWPAMTIALAVFALGIVDDRIQLRATARLLLHYLGGVLLATAGGICIVNVGNLLAMGDIPLLILAVPLTALSVAGLCNAYNMIDGIDGLAASMALLPLAVLLALSLPAYPQSSAGLLILVVPIALFLLFNLGPNNRFLPRVFLGDNGSVFLGFVVTAALVHFSQAENALIRPVTALWLVTVPLMDMLATMLKRLVKGEKLMKADRSHLHHALMARGLSPRLTLLVLCLWALGCALIGLALEGVPPYLSLLLYFLLFLGHCRFALNSRPELSQARLVADRNWPSMDGRNMP